MRWVHAQRALDHGYGPDAVTLVSTPLYSNTTLVSFFPGVVLGGTVVLMPKFDATRYLELAQRHRATHCMLVPVQYARLMAHPGFDAFDLTSFRMKFCTSAPFAAALKADILRRWPGGLIEYYGMTEGGGTVVLKAHERPDKLATVGQPAEGHDIRLIDEAGREVGRDDIGAIGEIVGHSPAMMSGYHRQPDKTREAEWYAAGRQALHPHRRRRSLRRRRLPDADGPQEGHDHQRRLQRLSQRPRGRADPAPGRGRGCGGRRHLGTLGRDPGGLRHPQPSRNLQERSP
jgi:acyl-CoA synthetase (AMP-forming)/AMP-acid ligase II